MSVLIVRANSSTTNGRPDPSEARKQIAERTWTGAYTVPADEAVDLGGES